MKSFDEITKEELIDLENSCWMTHDGMWFFSCLMHCGIEETNRLNKAAIKSLAPFEIARTKKTIGMDKEKIESFQEFKEYFSLAGKLFIPPFMNASMDFPRENVLRWEFAPNRCFAYKGMKRLGVIDQYECGVIYRIECWLDCLGVKFNSVPKVDKCLMHTTGRCSGDMELSFS